LIVVIIFQSLAVVGFAAWLFFLEDE